MEGTRGEGWERLEGEDERGGDGRGGKGRGVVESKKSLK